MKEIVSAAVNKAIDECIEEGILQSFFKDYREEVTKVAILEYSAEKHLQYEKEDSYNSGYDSGYGTGYDSGYDSGYGTGYDSGYNIGQDKGHSNGIKDTTDLFSWLKAINREADIIQAIDDPDHLAKLFDEFEQFTRK